MSNCVLREPVNVCVIGKMARLVGIQETLDRWRIRIAVYSGVDIIIQIASRILRKPVYTNHDTVIYIVKKSFGFKF